MKRFTLILASLFYIMVISAQTQADKYISEGIKLHDQGKYREAIGMYQKALVEDPSSSSALYEIAVSKIGLKQYDESINYCKKVIKLNDRCVDQAYALIGNCYSAMGNEKKAIKIYKKGIKKCGKSISLCYNLACSYYNLNDNENTLKMLMQSIEINYRYIPSHYLLGCLMARMEKKTQSILCFHYYLLNDPNSRRAQIAYTLLKQQFVIPTEKDKKTGEVSLSLSQKSLTENSEFATADMMINLYAISKYEEKNENKTDSELFIENTENYFKLLGELRSEDNKNLWWNFYIPIFYKIACSPFIDVYCKYISISSDEEALKWLNEHPEKLNSFSNWFNTEHADKD